MQKFVRKYAGKYAEFGKICGAFMLHMPHMRRVVPAFFAYFWHMQLLVTDNHNHDH